MPDPLGPPPPVHKGNMNTAYRGHTRTRNGATKGQSGNVRGLRASRRLVFRQAGLQAHAHGHTRSHCVRCSHARVRRCGGEAGLLQLFRKEERTVVYSMNVRAPAGPACSRRTRRAAAATSSEAPLLRSSDSAAVYRRELLARLQSEHLDGRASSREDRQNVEDTAKGKRRMKGLKVLVVHVDQR
jgi:hypothetical protein